MLIYASVMFTFRGVAGRNVPDRAVLLERLAPAPEIVVDGLLSRFTETPRGSAKYVRCQSLFYRSPCELSGRR
jgi:DNA-directed RNA polymerase I subunit RPA49